MWLGCLPLALAEIVAELTAMLPLWLLTNVAIAVAACLSQPASRLASSFVDAELGSSLIRSLWSPSTRIVGRDCPEHRVAVFVVHRIGYQEDLADRA
ncbi:hypothetical protein NL676_011887 [Syzygium grande]|nr:hypothetical protein NL676_011887 [Syzygium grande]